MAQMRIIVHDVSAAIAFYTGHLGFTLENQFGPAMAILRKGDQTLWLAGPLSSAAKPMPDGQVPMPGGWARMVLTVENLDAEAARLKAAGVAFRNAPLSGPGGRQVLIEDVSGNPIELFEPAQA
jgi:predicted enzyme related to lactoylglutathione lyase